VVYVRTNSEEFAAVTARLLRSFDSADGRAPEVTFTVLTTGDSSGPHRFYRGGKLIRETYQFWKLMRLLEWQLDVFLARTDLEHVLLHSGSVAVNGGGILIPGSSHAGKSSLTLSLLLRGAAYYSDEISAVGNDSGELTAFPKPLSCRDPSIFPEVTQDRWFGPRLDGDGIEPEPDGWKQVWFTHADDVRPGSVGTPVPITHVIFPDRGNGHSPSLEPMLKTEVMQSLLRHSVNFRVVRERGFRRLARVVERAQCFRLRGNGLDATSRLVMDELSA
jgi:hypothetical protein